MKKWFSILLAILMLSSVAALAEEADAVSSASVQDYYADRGVFGDELMDAINSFSGFYAVSTVNEDGTPQLGYYIYSCYKHEDTYYIGLGIAENQTRVNIENGSEAIAMYAKLPPEDGTDNYASYGARMWLKPVEDENLIKELVPEQYAATIILMEVTAVRSLG